MFMLWRSTIPTTFVLPFHARGVGGGNIRLRSWGCVIVRVIVGTYLYSVLANHHTTNEILNMATFPSRASGTTNYLSPISPSSTPNQATAGRFSPSTNFSTSSTTCFRCVRYSPCAAFSYTLTFAPGKISLTIFELASYGMPVTPSQHSAHPINSQTMGIEHIL